MRHFKITDKATLEAFHAYNLKRVDLVLQARKFAEQFAPATQVRADFYIVFGQLEFAGLIFSPARKGPLWTSPTRSRKHQKPRSVLPKTADDATKAAHIELVKKWDETYPDEVANLEHVFTAMGLCVASETYAYNLFIHGNAVYYQTSSPNAPKNGVAISSEEWDAAMAERNEKQASVTA